MKTSNWTAEQEIFVCAKVKASELHKKLGSSYMRDHAQVIENALLDFSKLTLKLQNQESKNA